MTDRETLRARARELAAREAESFAASHPRARAIAGETGRHFLGGVPLHWMLDWGTPFPLSIVSAEGCAITDTDGHRYVDFCLGDGGALFGHSPPAIARAIAAQAGHGLTAMLPGPDVAAVGARLEAIFGLPFWQVTATASDANRAVIRWARALTGRTRVLVFDGCYHGQVDEAFVDHRDGRTVLKAGLVGQAPGAPTSIAVPFNDLGAAEAGLAAGDVALVLTEPALTNTALVLPQPGFLEGLIALAHRHGALICLDETHTIATAYGGHTARESLAPDFFVLGKPVAGGLPAAVYGFTAAVEAGMRGVLDAKAPGYSGIGTTLSGNLLAMAAMRACLTEVMTPEAYAWMTALAGTLADRIDAEIARRGLPWSMIRLGARVELVFTDTPPVNSAAARLALDHDLERAIHLFLLNRGVLLTPFHNMMLVSPATGAAEVDKLVATLAAAFDALLGVGDRP
ncbi:MAG: aminotransferase class III-fold pyridoxal phosphate-dependent enzyme [Rhizobiales bacterium]|nr:aminotransferase class III-fold pyridoxal phosphate-dependent enzyme [Hyphomicrobiales bacterium]